MLCSANSGVLADFTFFQRQGREMGLQLGFLLALLLLQCSLGITVAVA